MDDFDAPFSPMPLMANEEEVSDISSLRLSLTSEDQRPVDTNVAVRRNRGRAFILSDSEEDERENERATTTTAAAAQVPQNTDNVESESDDSDIASQMSQLQLDAARDVFCRDIGNILKVRETTVGDPKLTFISDIDSILACCKTLEPFVCSVRMNVDIFPKMIQQSRNTKLTLYLDNRDKFTRNEQHKALPGKFYEFKLGTIDNRQLFVIFKLRPDLDPHALDKTSQNTNLREACSKFMHGVIVPAAEALPLHTLTRRTGLGNVSRDVKKTYDVKELDFEEFCTQVSVILRQGNLSELCGMEEARFYICEHGMRLRKEMARHLLSSMLHIEHPDIDVLQIHRADTMKHEDGPVLFSLQDRLRAILSAPGSISLVRSLQRYRVGFLASYGNFARHVAPRWHRNIVTFVQGYNSAAKMAQNIEFGAMACFAICRCGDRRTANYLQEFTNVTSQNIADLLFYSRHYVEELYETRIEEVLTFDACRHDIPTVLESERVFDERQPSLTTRKLFRNRLVFQFTNWQRYMNDEIGNDLRVIEETMTGHFQDFPFVHHGQVMTAMRSCFRSSYFIHGRKRSYNHEVLRGCFAETSEVASTSRDFVALHPAECEGDNGTIHFPIYTSLLQHRFVSPIKHLWDVMSVYRNDNPADFTAFLFISWAYVNSYYKKSDGPTVIASIHEDWTAFKPPLKLENFVRKLNYAAHSKFQINGYIDAKDLTKALFVEPQSPIAKVVCMALNANVDRNALCDEFYSYAIENIDVVPAVLLWRPYRLFSSNSPDFGYQH